MNRDRRKQIQEIIDLLAEIDLTDLLGDLEMIRDDEQEYLDYMPDSFKSGEKGELAEAVIGSLGDALTAVEDAMNGLTEAMNALEDAAA